MIKINFKNGASGKTPLNATNLNKLQDNIEEATMINRISIQGNSIQEGTPSVNSEAPIKSVGDNINYLPTDGSEWEQGAISSATGENTSNASRLRTKDFINIPSNQCNISIQNTNYVFVNIIMYNESNTFIRPYGDIDYSIVGNTSLDVSFPSECKKIKVVIKKTDDSTILTSEIPITKAKLGEGSKTPYSPYGQGSIEITLRNGTTSETKTLYTQQPFRAIGDVKDRFVKQNGVWYEEHKIARKIFNGTENWITAVIDDNYARVYTKINDKRDSGGNKTELKSNMFISRLFDEVYKQGLEGVAEYVGTNTSYYKNVYLKTLNTNISSTETATLTLFKAKLTELYNAGTPVYIDYVLATPTLIECTPEQVEVLSDIYSAYGEGLTNITCTDEVEPVIEIVKATKETVQSENDKAISLLLARIEELEKKIQ